MIDLKDIHIGKLLELRWKELNIPMKRTCNFFKLDQEKIVEMFQQKSLSCEHLLKWCKLLEYDFFRLYSQHIIFYSPPALVNYNDMINYKSSPSLPTFRKNLYTQEIIAFIMEQLETGEKTKKQVITEYRIPKTTLYKWISKYKDKI